MLKFEKLARTHIDILHKYLNKNTNYCCENTFGFVYLWKETENLYICEQDNVMYIVAMLNDAANFYFPFGDNITVEHLQLVDNYCLKNNFHLKFWYLTEENIDILQRYFKDRIELVNDRDWADYLYLYDDLLNLVGKKYHTQKNHINRFARTYVHELIPYDNTKKHAVEQFFIEYYKEQNKESLLFREERKVMQYLLDNYDDINLLGGLLIADDKVVAISFGEIAEDTMYVHFEKALKKYGGSYATINNLFLKMYQREDVKYINREEDIGDEGLRQAKMRLRPIRLVDKYFGDVKHDN